MVQTKSFDASLKHLHEMLRFILDEAKKMEFKPAALSQIELASEEAIVNVIEHAYQDRGGEIKISIQTEPKKKITISLFDQGAPFDPLKKSDPIDLSAPMEDREVGGLGIHFMLKCLDELSYRREGSWNVLVLVKNIPSEKLERL